MADLAAFLKTVGPPFEGQAARFNELMGSDDLAEILDYVREERHLDPLVNGGFKGVAVWKLFKAMQEEKKKAWSDEDVRLPKLEKTMTAVPEDEVTPGKAEVVVKSKLAHSSTYDLGLVTAKAEAEAAEAAPAAAATEEAEHKQEEFQVGAMVIVLAPFSTNNKNSVVLEKGMQGEITKIDAKGDACIRFQGVQKQQWVLARNFHNLHAIQDFSNSSDFPSLDAKPGARVSANAQALAYQEARKKEQTASANARAAAQLMSMKEESEAAASKPKGFGMDRAQYDRTLEFWWDHEVTKMLGNPPAPQLMRSALGDLTEEEFKAEFMAGLAAYCKQAEKAYDGVPWPVPEIEEWLQIMLLPKRSKRYGQDVQPNVILTFRSSEDCMGIQDVYKRRVLGDDEQGKNLDLPLLKVKGTTLHLRKPSSEYVYRIASERGSESASEVRTDAGSVASHSSRYQEDTPPMHVIFWNVPEDALEHVWKQVDIKNKLEEYVRGVCQRCPVPPSEKLYSFKASFSGPRRAPRGACFLEFKHETDGKKIDPNNGDKVHTRETFAKEHADKGKEWILKMWETRTPMEGRKPMRIATTVLKKRIAADRGQMTIAKWFMDEVTGEGKPKPTIGSGKPLEVKWQRTAPKS